MIRVLFDTDLLLEVLINRSGLVEDAEKVWKLTQARQIEVYVTEIGLDKIYSYCTELADSKVAYEIISSMQVIVSSCHIDRDLIEKARLSKLKDFESALELACAKDMKLDGVVTLNIKNFAEADFCVLLANELVEIVVKQQNLKQITQEKVSWKDFDLINNFKLFQSLDLKTKNNEDHSSLINGKQPAIIAKEWDGKLKPENRQSLSMRIQKYFFNTHTNLLPMSDSNIAIENSLELCIQNERLRQTRYSINLGLIATAFSACISLLGAGLLLSGKVSEGTVTATGGMAASVRCIQLAKDANDRLDKILAELHDET